MGMCTCTRAVGEHSVNRRRCGAIHAGGDRNDYAGMSNDKEGEKPSHRKSKDSSVKIICGGLVGP